MKNFLEMMSESDKIGPSLTERAKQIAGFNEKLHGFMGLINNSAQLPRHKREYLMKEAETTSDFPILFGTVLERTLLAKYTIKTPGWRNYVKAGTQNDFRPTNLIGTYGLRSQLTAVPQEGEYPNAALSEGKVQCSLGKFGRQFRLSWETLINDDLGAFSDVADSLVQAAIMTEWFQATKLIAQSTGPNTTLFGSALTHPIDGATVANKGVLALTADNLFTTITNIRNQKDSDGNPILLEGFELVVAPANEKAALVATSPAALIATGVGASAATTTSANVTANLNIRINVNPLLPSIDTTQGDHTWYVFGVLANGAAVQLNFLRGHEAPEIVQRASNKVSQGGGVVSQLEGDFETDSAAWRVRHVMGGATVDPRLAYAQVSST